MHFVIFEKYPSYFFVTKKKEGVPQAIFEKYLGTFLAKFENLTGTFC